MNGYARELETLVNSKSSDLESNPAIHELTLPESNSVDTPHEQSIKERDQKLQAAMDQLAIEYQRQRRRWTKQKLAYDLSMRPEYEDLTCDNIARITRKPKLSN